MEKQVDENIQLNIQILLKKIQELCTKYKIYGYGSVIDIKKRSKEYNKFHNEIMSLLASVIKNDDNLELYKKNFLSYRQYNITSELPFDILAYYLINFKNAYYTLKNGEYSFKNDYIIDDIESKDEHRQKITSIADDIMYPILIKPSGECYFAQNGHENLCKWLYLTKNENLHSSIRLDVDRLNKRFEFSAIFGYTDQDEDCLKLTNEQAEALGKLYFVMTDMFGEFVPLHESALYSSGLCLGSHEKFNEICQHNIKKLKKNLGKEFDIQMYNRIKNYYSLQ